MDWSIPQIVASENKSVIVLTDGSCTERTFGGTIIQYTKHDLIGTYIPDFYKHAYKPCKLIVEF